MQVLLVVLGMNGAYLCFIISAQELNKSLPSRNSIIPGTNQKFLYVQDFWTMTYGDFLGVPLVVNAFVHLAADDITNLWWTLGIGMLSTMMFLKMCLGKNHKPDYGFPGIGKISFAGILHLPYFGFGIGASAMSAWNLIIGELRGPVMWVALAGGAVYVGCFVLEIRSGNFDPLKKKEIPCS